MEWPHQTPDALGALGRGRQAWVQLGFPLLPGLGSRLGEGVTPWACSKGRAPSCPL